MNEWIRTEDELPKDMICVLTTIQVVGRELQVRSGLYHDEIFSNDNGDVWRKDDVEVVAWMPLPEPYREEQK